MTSPELEKPPRPRKDATDRFARRCSVSTWSAPLVSVLIASLLVILIGSRAAAQQYLGETSGRDSDVPAKRKMLDQHPEGPIDAIIIEGLHSISEEKVRDKLLCRVGRPLDLKVVKTDVKSLRATGWFSDIGVEYSRAPETKGVILFFKLAEKQIIREVKYEGRSKISEKEIEKATQIKVGGRANWLQAQMAVRQIQSLYTEKGYDFANVKLIEGGNPGDTRIHYRIFEGPKSQIGRVEFVGNTVFVADLLRTKISLGSKLLGLLPGTFQIDEVDADVRKLVEFYQNVGYMDTQVTPIIRRGETRGRSAHVRDRRGNPIQGSQYRFRRGHDDPRHQG